MRVLLKSSTRRAVGAYAGLFLLADVSIALPGDSLSLSGGRKLVVGLLIQGLVVWGLSRGSALAWTVGLVMSVPTAAFLISHGGPRALLAGAAFLVQVWLLLTPRLRGFVWSRRRAPTAST